MNKLAFVLILFTMGLLNTVQAQENVKKKGLQEVQIKNLCPM